MFDLRKLNERANHDNEFACLVDLMGSLIIEHGWGMTEFREAAFLATARQLARADVRFLIPDFDKTYAHIFTCDVCRTHVPRFCKCNKL